MSDTEEAMSMLDNIEEHAEFQHHEIERLTRERDEAREWLTESRDNAQRLLEAANGWKLAAEEARNDERTAMAYLADVRAIVGGDDFPDMVRRVSEARAECERMREDAERYEWVTNEFADGHARHPKLDDATDIDAAIDAARRAG